jgi:CheY-like chemotaxis protein
MGHVLEHIASRKLVLVAEDNPNDVLLLKYSVARAGIESQITFVRDGEEVLDYLKGEGEFSDRKAHPYPELLLLDLKMPRLDGFDVLAWIRQQPTFKRLLIVVLTSSTQEKDINRAYDLGVNSYLVKPSDFQMLSLMIERLQKYWLELNMAAEQPSRVQGDLVEGISKCGV